MLLARPRLSISGLSPKNKKDFDNMRTKELNNGRLMMLGIAGMVDRSLPSL
jgi:hypothetical protein